MRIETGKEEIIKYSYVCDLCGKGAEHHRVCGIYVPVVRNLILEKQEKFDAIVEDLEQEWRDEAVNYQIIWRRKIKLRN